MSFRTKLLASFAALGLAAIAVTDWQASSSASAALRQGTYERLTAIRETKRQLIENYFRDLTSHVLALSTDDSTIEALEQFRAAWNALPEPRATRLRDAFGTATEGRDLLLSPPALGSYSRVHARFHPTLHRYQTAFGFYDIFLIDTAGQILYTVFKEPDLGGHLRHPPLAATTLARAFERALALDSPEKSVLEDYAPYAPSQRSPAAFAAASIWRAGAKAGVLAIQVSAGEVNRAMQSEALGGTGQAYLVGADGRLRSGLRDAGESAILSLTPTVFERKPGIELGTGLNGAPVLRSHTPLDIAGLDWMLVAEIEAAEAFAPLQSLRRRTLGAGLAVSALFLAAAWKLGRSVSRPLLALTAGARRLAERDFSVQLPVESADEIGELAGSFNDMARRLERTTVSRDELERLNHRLIHAQEQERSRLARELHDDVTQRLAALAIRAGRLKQSAGPASAEMEQMQRDLSRLSDDLHGLSRRLHPAILDELGLIASIESECRGFFESGGPPVDFEHTGSTGALPPEASLALYRIVQESLRNALRHAQATEIHIGLHCGPREAKLEIEDNGVGFDRASPDWRAGLGLASMEERVRLLNGGLVIDSRPGTGTRIQVTVPYEETQNRAG